MNSRSEPASLPAIPGTPEKSLAWKSQRWEATLKPVIELGSGRTRRLQVNSPTRGPTRGSARGPTRRPPTRNLRVSPMARVIESRRQVNVTA